MSPGARAIAAGFVAFAVVAGAPFSSARAEDGAVWDPAWGHSNAWDYTVGGVAATAFTVELAALQGTQAPLRWTNPILFDADVRSALRISDQGTRDAVDLATWGLLTAQIAYPVVVDAPYAWARYGFWLARDLFWQDAATLFLAGALDFALRDVAGRARPYVYECLHDGGSEATCVTNPESVRSFPGGHVLTATAASVLTCTQHLYVHLYGGSWDAILCAMTLASDAAVSVMRIAVDSHWATDEIAGIAIGALIGWGVPYVMHFHRHTRGSARPPPVLVMPAPVGYEGGGGLGVVGLF